MLSSLTHSTTTSTTIEPLAATVAINAAFLQEIKEDNYELPRHLKRTHAVLRRATSRPVRPRRVVEMLTDLRDRLAMHFALEEAYGYFDDAVTAAPHLSNMAHHLRQQHTEFFSEICGLVETAERLLYREIKPTETGQRRTRTDLYLRFERFHNALREHEMRENEMILQAFDEDLGVGD